MIPLAKPIVTEEMKEAAMRVMNGTDFILGREVQEFENEFAKMHNAKYAVALSSGTTALTFALLACEIKPKDEVLSVPNSFVSSANCAIYDGAIPRFVDADLETYNIDVTKIEEKITKKTKAIIPVHLFGHPADMDPIMEIAEKHRIHVIEDACQAHGSSYKRRKVGSIGRVGCFSFYPSKNITVCGDGGLITTDDKQVLEKIRMLRDYGRTDKYIHTTLGYNARLNEINAAIGRIQLKHLDEWNKKRRKNAQTYNDLLRNEHVVIPVEKDWAYHVYHMYPIRSRKRDKLRIWLEKKGVQTGVHYPVPIHLQPLYKQMFGYMEGMYPVSERVAKEILSLPVHPSMTENDVNYVVQQIREFQNT
jgi:dTDP-4-amino-4,6-dideoxygalactose transaminase